MEEWKEYKAIDFCTNVTDGTHDSPKPKEKGHYLITSKHLRNNSIDFSSAYRISEEDYKKVIQRSKVEQYDILFSMIGMRVALKGYRPWRANGYRRSAQ